ncbi:MAG TPA: dUTP diphosphatase [Oligoflexia bacterium]|nr:dUTP diphosphatase [Oligoflexia bacterium]HMR24768.1 dUTP diphosphatase [Oligoflexia bacterium]
MNVKIKKLVSEAVIPAYAKEGDAGMDLTCVSVDQTEMYVEYGTGLALEIPQGYCGLLFPRSSVSKTGQSLCNSIGLVDSGYRGELRLRYYAQNSDALYAIGDKVGQLLIMPYPSIQLEEVSELSTSERAQGGFGSTGQ